MWCVKKMMVTSTRFWTNISLKLFIMLRNIVISSAPVFALPLILERKCRKNPGTKRFIITKRFCLDNDNLDDPDHRFWIIQFYNTTIWWPWPHLTMLGLGQCGTGWAWNVKWPKFLMDWSGADLKEEWQAVPSGWQWQLFNHSFVESMLPNDTNDHSFVERKDRPMVG
jgi:hypothetical protein